VKKSQIIKNFSQKNNSQKKAHSQYFHCLILTHYYLGIQL